MKPRDKPPSSTVQSWNATPDRPPVALARLRRFSPLQNPRLQPPVSRTRLIVFVVAACLVAPPFVLADELDPVTSIESNAPSASAPVVHVLRPLEWILRSAHPELNYTYVRAEGVLSAPGAEETTTIQTVSLSTFFNLGQFITFRYRPSWTYYSSDAFDNSFGHEAGLQFQRSFGEWNVRASHRYSDTSTPLVETGTQTSQTLHMTNLQGQRRLGARTTLELGLRHATRRADGFASSEDWSTQEWLHYQLTDKVGVAGGFLLGYASLDGGNDMNYRQINGRVRWRPTSKLWLDANAGVETREFMESSVDNANNPVYGATLTYQPFDHTTLTIEGDQALASSYFQNQIHRSNNWQARLSQRLFGRYQLGLSYRQRNASYSATADFIAVSRQDEGRTWRIDLGTAFYNRGAITLFLQDKRNVSTDPRFAFDGQQFGLQLNIAF